MTAAEYRAARKLRGTQEQVAAILGIDPDTLTRRERDITPVSEEAARALLSIPVRRRAASKKR